MNNLLSITLHSIRILNRVFLFGVIDNPLFIIILIMQHIISLKSSSLSNKNVA